jgi:hypothetical protein
MKKKSCLLFSVLLLAFIFTTKNILAQSPGNWGNWETMPCYQGISVSIVNMGYSKSAGGYLWGIRLKNNYATPVTLKYRLSIGEKNTSQEGGDAVWKLKPGDIWTDGNDKFTAKLYQSSSTESNCYIWNVSFGDVSNCFAGCDVVKAKENQQCPVASKKPATTNPATATNASGTGNTNTPPGKTKPAAANNANPAVFNKADVERDCRKVAAVHCKLAETETKIYELQEAGKTTDKLYKEVEKLCKEVFDNKFLFLPEKYAGKKGALELWNKIWAEEFKKCPYSYQGICIDFE